MPVKAVFFDVDFTLIYPGPTFQGVGYQRFCARHGINIDPSRFADAVLSASATLSEAQDHIYDAEIFVRYTRRIIEGMGGRGARLDACANEIYVEWAACNHFFLYDDVTPALRELANRGVKVGLISNSHRCLVSFQQHFELHGLIAGALSSSERISEATPQYLRFGAEAARCCRCGVGDGWRQLSARHRRCTACWHARHSCSALDRP